jgi:hypothetical protein
VIKETNPENPDRLSEFCLKVIKANPRVGNPDYLLLRAESGRQNEISLLSIGPAVGQLSAGMESLHLALIRRSLAALSRKFRISDRAPASTVQWLENKRQAPPCCKGTCTLLLQTSILVVMLDLVSKKVSAP